MSPMPLPRPWSPIRAASLMAVALPLLAVVASGTEAGHPNVLVVMTDDQGLGDFSYTGNPILRTPHLDAFAGQSIRFTDFHVAPMCSPTRGQLLTGLSALRNGATSVTAGRTFLRPGLPTLPELFAAAGYATGLFGKWHLGDAYPHRPVDKGFQESLYHLGWGQLHSTAECGWPLIDGRCFHNGVEQRYQGHCTDVWFEAAKEWMKQQKDAGKPFLCYLPTNAPHGPHVDLEEFVAPYRKNGVPAGFFGMIAHVDARFGDLDQFLAAEGLRDDTIVIFMTDNGGTDGVKTFNAGLRGGKTTYYEGGHRVPCWVRWPRGGLGGPRDIDVPTQNTDVLPTLCDLCNVAPPGRPVGDLPYAGTSLAGLLRGAATAIPERTLVVQYGQTPQKHDACVIRGPWRLVKGKELYDVSVDRGQARDISDDHPEIVSRLRSDYEQWWSGVEPSLDRFVPQSIGAKQQPVVELTSGDWEDVYADNFGLVRGAVGGANGGRWHIHVERPGTYSFALWRWPPRMEAAIGGDCPAPGIPRPQGKAAASATFPGIAQAHVRIAGIHGQVPADPADTTATVQVALPSGTTTLEAWFADTTGTALCGAFFVTASLVEAPGGDEAGRGARSAPAKRPNVVYMLADDLGWGDIGCHGGPTPTPAIDRLFASGVELRQFMGWCVCSPTRAMLLTGRHPFRVGTGPEVGGELAAAETTIGEVFRSAGYRTGVFGKWHNGDDPDTPEYREAFAAAWKDKPNKTPSRGLGVNAHGFDDAWIYYGGGADYFTRRTVDNRGPVSWWHNREFRPRDEGYTEDLITKKACAFLRESAGGPFFCYVPFHLVHDPMQAKQEDLAAVDASVTAPDKRIYAAMVRALDANVGRILATLDELGLRDDTIVVFTSDNGATPQGRNLPLRGTKHTILDGGVRLPTAIHWPRGGVAGRQWDGLSSGMDMLPSLASLAGIPVPPTRPLDGRDIGPALSAGTESPVEGVYWAWHGVDAIRTPRWKLHRFFDRMELYDMSQDPGEETDVAAAHPDIVTEMTSKLDGWAGSLSAALSHRPPALAGAPAPDGDVLEVSVTVTDKARPADQLLVHVATLEKNVEATDHVEFDVAVMPGSLPDRFFYTPFKRAAQDNTVRLFKRGDGIDQFGREQVLGPAPRGPAGAWEHRVVGLCSYAPHALPLHGVVFTGGRPGTYTIQLDNLRIRHADGSTTPIWTDRSHTRFRKTADSESFTGVAVKAVPAGL